MARTACAPSLCATACHLSHHFILAPRTCTAIHGRCTGRVSKRQGAPRPWQARAVASHAKRDGCAWRSVAKGACNLVGQTGACTIRREADGGAEEEDQSTGAAARKTPLLVRAHNSSTSLAAADDEGEQEQEQEVVVLSLLLLAGTEQSTRGRRRSNRRKENKTWRPCMHSQAHTCVPAHALDRGYQFQWQGNYMVKTSDAQKFGSQMQPLMSKHGDKEVFAWQAERGRGVVCAKGREECVSVLATLACLQALFSFAGVNTRMHARSGFFFFCTASCFVIHCAMIVYLCVPVCDLYRLCFPRASASSTPKAKRTRACW